MKYLITEGQFDTIVFLSLLEAISLKNIEIKPPIKHGRPYNGKGNVIQLLPELIKSSRDGAVEKIAVVVDADFQSVSNQGYQNTLKQIEDTVKAFGYSCATLSGNRRNGLIFKSDQGYIDFAAWIMPDNSNDGFIERFLLASLLGTEAVYKDAASKIAATSVHFKYIENHKDKAVLAHYMALQENPGRNFSNLFAKNLVDVNASPMKDFTSWIKSYFES